jgi:hypothetical protein
MSVRMMPAVYLAISRPVLKRFCSRIRATDSALMPSHVPFLLLMSWLISMMWS